MKGKKMISEQYRKMLAQKSVIRQLSEAASRRAAQIGAENVFDYSLGNPSVPAPESFHRALRSLLENSDPMALHGYSPTLGIPSVKEKIADSLNRRFGMNYEPEHIFPVSAAAAAIAHALRAVTKSGDEVLTFAPFFPEYHPYVDLTGAQLKVVPPDTETFQPNLAAFEKLITEKTKAVIVNTPNNPTGVVYSAETLKRLADILEEKQKEWKTSIYLISDEPYRELVYGGVEVPWIPDFYRNTIVGYSFSKSLSLPGERIGYLVLPSEMDDSEAVKNAANVATRILGYVNAPSFFQRVVARCLEEKADIAYYDRNRETLYEGLKKAGLSCIKPEGAFYLFVKSPVEDEKVFCEKAKKQNLLLVPGSSFACPGYVRLAYCVSYEMIVRSLPHFEELMKEYR